MVWTKVLGTEWKKLWVSSPFIWQPDCSLSPMATSAAQLKYVLLHTSHWNDRRQQRQGRTRRKKLSKSPDAIDPSDASPYPTTVAATGRLRRVVKSAGNSEKFSAMSPQEPPPAARVGHGAPRGPEHDHPHRADPAAPLWQKLAAARDRLGCHSALPLQRPHLPTTLPLQEPPPSPP